MSAKESSSSHTPGRGLRRVDTFVETITIGEFLRQCVATVLVGTTLFTGMPAKAEPNASGSIQYPLRSTQRPISGANTAAAQVKSVSARRVRSAEGVRGTQAIAPASTVPTVGFDSSAQSGSAAHSDYFGQFETLEPFSSWAQVKPETTTIADLRPGMPGLLPVTAAALQQESGEAGPNTESLSASPASNVSSITSNFNGTSIAAKNTIWFNAIFKPSGIGSSPVRIFLRNQTITFSANGVSYNLSVPDSTITFSSSNTTSTVTINTLANEWMVNTKPGLSGNYFMAGLPFVVPAGGLPGGINPVTWTGTFYTDTSGITLNWEWAAAVYTQFSGNLGSLGVKPIDANSGSQYNNSDHAGTPESFKTSVTGGARGGGGSNYTGSYSGTAGVTPAVQVPNYPPVANAGPNQTVFVSNTVHLDGSGSFDADGDPLTYSWSFVSVPAGSTATLANPTTVNPSFTVDKPGNYVAQLIVNDGKVNSTPATVTISTQNSPPVANAGPNQTVTTHTTVQLDGSKSTDVDGDPLTFQWTIASKPATSAATLSNPTLVNPTFVVDVKGTYTIQLIVNDGHVNSTPATVTISNVNSPPVANAGPNQTIIANHTVQLDGSGSTDVDGDSLTYRWAILSTPPGSTATLSSATAVKPTFFADLIGDYVVQLIVNDGTANSTPSTVTITTNDVPPVANAGPAQTVPLGSLVNLDGSASTDVDGKPLTYQWSLTGKPAGSTATLGTPTAVNPYFTVDKAGNYVAQLIVNDGFLNSQPATVTISTINSKPVANPGPAQTVPVGTTVQLDGSGSSDADGDSLTYSWAILSQPSGGTATISNATAINPTFVAGLAGTYVVQLIVNDGKVNSDPATTAITATPQNQPPVVNAGLNQTITLPANTVTLNGTATDDGLPNGTLTIQWTEVSGPAPVTFSSPNTAVTNATFTVAGTYVLQLSANDSQLTSTSTTTVTVLPANVNQPPVVNAGPNQTITLPTNIVTLNGKATDDGLPNGTLIIQWAEISGPAPVIFGSPNTAVTNVTFTAAGVYLLQLTANDSQLSSSSNVIITVNPGGNQAPVVNAGPSQTITLPDNVLTLNGTVTDDGLPSGILLINWAQIGGASPVFFSTPNKAVTQATFSAAGTYVLQLTANDTQLSSSSNVTIIVNPPPQAGSLTLTPSNAGPDVAATSQSLQAVLKDSSANPVAGAIVTFTISGPNPGTGTATTDATGTASFAYSGAHPGEDIVEAQAAIGPNPITSNVASVNWITPVNKVATTPILGRFFTSDGSQGFDIQPWQQPVFSQEFPVINFDPVSATDTADPTGRVNHGTAPFTDVTFDQNGNFSGYIPAQGNGAQAGVSSTDPTKNLNVFQAVFTGEFTIPAAEDVLFTFRSDDGFQFGVGNGATRVGGVYFNAPLSGVTPFQNYPILGAYDIGGFANPRVIVVHFPAPGRYPFEADYSECCGFPLSFTMSSAVTDNHTVPPVGSLVLTPNTVAAQTIGQSQSVTIQATDGSGSPVAELPVTLNVTGSNPQQLLARTDLRGNVFFTWPGVNTGTDLVQAQAVLSGVPSLSNQVSVQWNAAANQPPVVDAGPNQSITLPANTVTLNGSVTDDGLPNGTLIINWSKVSGPGAVSFSAPATAVTQASFGAAGTYVLQLSANDSQFTSTALVTVTVASPQNAAPVVNAGPNQITMLPANAVVLNGTASDDGLPNGTLTTTWSKVSGPGTVVFSTPASLYTVATFGATGTYVLRLSASDSQLTSTSDVTVVVNPLAGNHAPIVSSGANQTITLPANTVTLNGTATDDRLPVNILLTVWGEVSGPAPVSFSNPNSPVTQAAFSQPGTYVLRLTANDTQFSVSSDVTVTVNPANTGLLAVNAGANQVVSGLPATATLNGSITEPNPPTLTIAWTQVSGPAQASISSPNQAVTQVSLPVPGPYVFQLFAQDAQSSASSTVTVTVGDIAPDVNAGPGQTLTLPTNTATLNGTVNTHGVPASQVGIVWSETGGPGTVTFSNPNQLVTQVTFPTNGQYILQLNASIGSVNASSTVVIFVVPPDLPPPTVTILAPQDDGEITQPTAVVGSVSVSFGRGNWTLDYSRNTHEGDSTQQLFTTIATGAGNVGGLLGTFDPTLLLNGDYTIRLTATDSAGLTSSTSVNVDVARKMKVGVFTLSFNDLSVPLSGLPITVVRTYDSRDKHVGDFGVGWTLSINNVRLEKNRPLGPNWQETTTINGYTTQYCLLPANTRTVTVTFPDDRVYKFQAAQHCSNFTPITAATLGFTQVPTTGNTAGATLAPADGGAVLIDSSVPGPQNLVDYNGNVYNPTVFRLTTAEGYVYIIDQKLGVTSLTDPAGNTLTINASGITSSTGTSVAFNRDGQGRITQIADPNGKLLTYSYDSNGDLHSFTDRTQNTSTFGYIGNHYLNAIQDPRGINPMRNDYDDSGRLIDTIDAFGKKITYDHHIDGKFEVITDRLGNPTTYTYDVDGNITSIIDALNNTTRFAYDSLDNKIAELNPVHSRPTTFSYDQFGNMLTQVDALGETTAYTYNANKQVLTLTDANDAPNTGVTTNSYDIRNGNLLTSLDAENHLMQNVYYPHTTLPQTTSVDGVQQAAFVYDNNGNLTDQTDALGNHTTFTYDSNGNKLTQNVTRTLTDGVTQQSLTTKYFYDDSNRLVKTVAPDGTFTLVHYNSIGKQDVTTDALGRQTKYEYDDAGRLTKTTYPDQTFESTGYDAEGHRISSTDRAGNTTTYQYDPLGRLVKTFGPGNVLLSTTNYDAGGRVASTVDALGNQTSYGYDDADRRIQVTQTTPQFNLFTFYAYDKAGNQTSVKDANQNTTQFVYDKLGRKTKTIYPDQTFDLTTYDSLGRLASKQDQAGKITQYGYDANSWLTSVTQTNNGVNLVTSYGYDEVGNRIAQTDANGHTTKYEYDQLGHRSKRTLPAGQVETYTYDADGNLKTKTDFNGKTTTYAYDTVNRLLSKTPDGSFNAAPISYTYFPNGLRQTMTDPSGTTTYNYDNRNRLLSKATPFGTLAYTYDAANLLTITSSNLNGAAMTYTYDTLNRLATVQDASGTTTYNYDPVGNLASFVYPNGVQHSYTYDPLNRLTQMGATKNGTALSSYIYTLGAAGNRLSVAELSGRNVSYGYDDLYRLTAETISCAAPSPNCTTQKGSIGYAYDNVGNRQSITSTVSAIPSGSQITYDADDHLTTDNYDADGNTISSGGILNVYDFENHLIKHGNVTILYDGDGNRVSETVGGVATSYFVDTNNPTGYAQVVEELQNGNVVRRYSYGLERISETQNINGTLTTSFYGYDGHGSVRQLFSSTGAITDRYDYDAFGNLIASTGNTPNNYLFAGESYDAALGMYFLRARYYNQNIGRFWTMDTYEGDPQSPGSFHKYLYGGDDPVNKLDPSGNDFSLPGILTTNAVIMSLASGIVSGLIAGVDKSMQGASPLEIAEATRRGVLFGLVTGPFINVTIIRAVIAGLAIGGSAVGAIDAWLEQKNKLAAFRALVLLAAIVGAGNLLGSNPTPIGTVFAPSVNTPYGPAIQSMSPAAVNARNAAASGATLYKIGVLGKSTASDAQFWSLDNPLTTPGYAQNQGMPAQNLQGDSFVLTGTLKPGAAFITRPSPGVGTNAGGALEVVVGEGGVDIDSFTSH